MATNCILVTNASEIIDSNAIDNNKAATASPEIANAKAPIIGISGKIAGAKKSNAAPIAPSANKTLGEKPTTIPIASIAKALRSMGKPPVAIATPVASA